MRAVKLLVDSMIGYDVVVVADVVDADVVAVVDAEAVHGAVVVVVMMPPMMTRLLLHLL